MPLDPVSVPPFPNVPPYPGVPPLLRSAVVGALTNVIPLPGEVTALVQGILGTTAEVQWGVFTEDGAPVITGVSCLAFEYAKDQRVADFPIERGAFASYNKVDTPADCQISFAAAETAVERADFLLAIEPQLLSLDLFTVVTPDKSYANMNIVHYGYRRTVDQGHTLLVVDVFLREIRVAPAAEFTSTKQPTGESTRENGPVQATTVPPVVAQERALAASGDIRP